MSQNFATTITGHLPDPSEDMIASFSVDGSEPTILQQQPASVITMDDLPKAAYDQGLVQTVQALNEQSQRESLQEQGIVPQAAPEAPIAAEKPPFVKKKQRSINKRFDDLVARAYEAENERDRLAEERDAYAIRMQEIEHQLLVERNRKLNQDLESLSGLMKQAHHEEDTDSFIEANKLISELTQQKLYNEQNLQQSQNNLSQIAQRTQYLSQESQSDSRADEEKEELLKALSHNRELNSEEYQDWLSQNDYYNPYSPDFDAHMAQDVRDIKNDINRFLYAQGLSEYIGTSRYYEEIDKKIQEKASERFVPSTIDVPQFNLPQNGGHYAQAPQQPQYAPQPYAQGENVSMPNFHSGSLSSVAPVTRSGYQTPYAEPTPAQFNLTEAEKFIARMCPMTDAPDPRNRHSRPRQLTEDEKYARYQFFKNQTRKRTSL